MDNSLPVKIAEQPCVLFPSCLRSLQPQRRQLRPPLYTITPIGTTGSIGTGINASGEITGYFYTAGHPGSGEAPGHNPCLSLERYRRFWDAMRDRLQEFALTLHPDKTRLIEFGRRAASRHAQRGLAKPETFNFLGLPSSAENPAKDAFS